MYLTRYLRVTTRISDQESEETRNSVTSINVGCTLHAMRR